MFTRISRCAVLTGSLAIATAALSFRGSLAMESPPAEVASAEKKKLDPKPLADYTLKGIEYLASQQQTDGGWGQGGGWRSAESGGRREGENVADPSDLGDTCIATLALIRAGNTPRTGKHANEVARAAEFICKQVQNAEQNGIYVTDVRDTQMQRKIGQYVDTFVAGLTLSELKGHMASEKAETELAAALAKTIAKIEQSQQEDGTFAGNSGWASILSQGLCSKFLNRAAQQKLPVKQEMLQRDFAQSVTALGGKSSGALPAVETKMSKPRISIADRGKIAVGRADAGVDLYNSASNAGRIHSFYESNLAIEKSAREVLASRTADAAAKGRARDELKRVDEVKQTRQAAAQDIILKLDDKDFVAGFGNNGGEEFLSYMNISEMLAAPGNNEWYAWDKAVSESLAKIQNGDGSWSGHHCITGRTFCTATALLTLMADRAAGQLADQIKAQK